MQTEPLTKQQIQDVAMLASVMTSVPKEKRPYVSVALSAFMAGMGVNQAIGTNGQQNHEATQPKTPA